MIRVRCLPRAADTEAGLAPLAPLGSGLGDHAPSYTVTPTLSPDGIESWWYRPASQPQEEPSIGTAQTHRDVIGAALLTVLEVVV